MQMIKVIILVEICLVIIRGFMAVVIFVEFS